MTTHAPPCSGRIAPGGAVAPPRGGGASLRALVLLGGSVRPSALSRAIDRSLLDLPLEPGVTILAAWRREAAALAQALDLPALPVRVVIDPASPAPTVPPGPDRAPVVVERDVAEYRGTGGVLRDLAVRYEGTEALLVANAAQVLAEPLASQAAGLLAAGGDVALTAHADGTPVGLMLVRCGVLDGVSAAGFIDFKEQVLPRLAVWHEVRVVRRSRPGGLPVRTLDGYLAGLRAYHRLRQGREPHAAPFDEDWRPTFGVAEAGARVGEGARVHDSVVLAGGSVEARAVVVRSVVCAGGTVRAGRVVADRLVGGAAERALRRSA